MIARGLPPGLGSFAQWDRRLDGRIAQALMSIHAVKAVAIGEGFAGGEAAGAAFHDEILCDDARGLERPTNRAGGLEGGVTNGEELRALAVVKPIPTLLIALRSVDLTTKEPRRPRSSAATPASSLPPASSARRCRPRRGGRAPREIRGRLARRGAGPPRGDPGALPRMLARRRPSRVLKDAS